MKVLVIDDEPLAADNLAAKIRRIDSGLKVETVYDPIAALQILRTTQPDVVFLDITMPELSGFELLGQLEESQRGFALVFYTAHSEFALEAFEAAALDYLVKPAAPERIEQALQKAAAAIGGAWRKRLDASPLASPLRKVALKNSTSVFWVQDSEIAYLQSEAHETVLYTADSKEHFCGLSLAALEERLDTSVFLRCHRSVIVNLNCVVSLDLKANAVIVKTGGDTQVSLPVSRRAKPSLKERFM